MRRHRSSIETGAAVGLMLALTYALKRHYSTADADALTWILAPTAKLVEMLVGAPFIGERGIGYVNNEIGFAIAPSCAGVNFMIIAICASTLGFVGRFETLMGKLGFVTISIPIAYVATLGVNGLRIGFALFLREHPVRFSGLSATQIHHAEGVVIYFTSLCLLYALLERVVMGRPRR